jgi:hypothetical protein
VIFKAWGRCCFPKLHLGPWIQSSDQALCISGEVRRKTCPDLVTASAPFHSRLSTLFLASGEFLLSLSRLYLDLQIVTGRGDGLPLSMALEVVEPDSRLLIA